MFVILILLCTQKTAYEMRIGDWTSDVGSSDLAVAALAAAAEGASAGEHRGPPVYAYCTVRDRQSGTIFSSNAFTIEVGGLALDRKGGVQGKSVYVRVDLGGRRILTKQH